MFQVGGQTVNGHPILYWSNPPPPPPWKILDLPLLSLYYKHCKFLFSQVFAQVNGPGGKIGILLKSFSNPKLLDASGSCCDPACTTCDYYFVFCVKESSSGNCCTFVKNEELRQLQTCRVLLGWKPGRKEQSAGICLQTVESKHKLIKGWVEYYLI